MQEGTGCILHFKTHKEIKFHLTADKGKDLQFQREVRPPSETWRFTKKIITQLQTFTNCRLWYILGVWWPKKISNEELWQRTLQERIEVTIRRRKWRWIGHTLRKPATNITRLSLEWNPQGVSRKGGPKKSWRRTIQQEYEDLGMSWQEVKRNAKDWVRWKAVVEALCSDRSEED